MKTKKIFFVNLLIAAVLIATNAYAGSQKVTGAIYVTITGNWKIDKDSIAINPSSYNDCTPEVDYKTDKHSDSVQIGYCETRLDPDADTTATFHFMGSTKVYDSKNSANGYSLQTAVSCKAQLQTGPSGYFYAVTCKPSSYSMTPNAGSCTNTNKLEAQGEGDGVTLTPKCK